MKKIVVFGFTILCVALFLLFRTCGSEEEVLAPTIEQAIKAHREAQQRNLARVFDSRSRLVEQAIIDGRADLSQEVAAARAAAEVALQQQRDIDAIGVPTPATEALIDGVNQAWNDLKSSILAAREELERKHEPVIVNVTYPDCVTVVRAGEESKIKRCDDEEVVATKTPVPTKEANTGPTPTPEPTIVEEEVG